MLLAFQQESSAAECRRLLRNQGILLLHCSHIDLKGKRLEQVDTFQYLGSLITEDAECNKEIRGRIARGQSAEIGMKQIWKSCSIKLTTKVRLMKALVWPVATYVCERWTIKKEMKKN